MADVVTEVTTRGPLAQLGRAITSVLVGIVMFFASFGVLWWNEGRQDVSEFVAEAVAIDANAPGMDQALAKSTGPISITQAAGDPQYLTGGNWLVLDRTAEMYAWVEDKQTTTKKQGTKEVTETTYTYTMKWTSDPKSSSSFHEPNGHENPTMSEMDLLSKATGVRVGSISVPFQEAQYRGSKPLTLSDDILLNSYYYEAAGNILYLRQGAGSNLSLIHI